MENKIPKDAITTRDRYIFSKECETELPSTVNVCGIDYDILQTEVIKAYEDRNNAGLCDYFEQVIKVLRDLPPQRKRQVFIHELVHAILNEAGISDHEESLVESLTRVFYQVLKDNDFSFMRN